MRLPCGRRKKKSRQLFHIIQGNLSNITLYDIPLIKKDVSLVILYGEGKPLYEVFWKKKSELQDYVMHVHFKTSGFTLEILKHMEPPAIIENRRNGFRIGHR